MCNCACIPLVSIPYQLNPSHSWQKSSSMKIMSYLISLHLLRRTGEGTGLLALTPSSVQWLSRLQSSHHRRIQPRFFGGQLGAGSQPRPPKLKTLWIFNPLFLGWTQIYFRKIKISDLGKHPVSVRLWFSEENFAILNLKNAKKYGHAKQTSVVLL